MDRRRLPSLASRRAQALVGYPFAATDVVVIGDTPHDIDCARACGAVAVAVTTGQYTRDELLAERPDHLFDDLADVEKVKAILGG
jgi:phosphoglycolate phosphatase